MGSTDPIEANIGRGRESGKSRGRIRASKTVFGDESPALTNTEKRDGEPETLVDLANAEDNSIVGQLNAEIPVVINDRQKRLSDQRLAELQTLMRIQKINARLGAVTRGGRHVNALKVGRRKRSVFEMNMKNLRKLFKLSGQLGGYKGNLAFPAIS